MSNPRRIAKLMTAGSLFAVAAYVLVNESLSVTSEDAVVNARILTVRAPIEGVVDMPRLQVGQAVRAGQRLGEITNSRADEGRVRDLERTATALAFELDALAAKAADIDAARDRLARQSDAYRQTRLQQISARIAEAGSALAASRAVAAELAAAYGRIKTLAEKGVQPQAAVDKAVSLKERDAHEAAAAEQRLETLKIELDAARRGVFVNDTIDVDWSRQQDQELDLRKQELAADIADRRRRLDAIRGQIAAEKASYEAQRELEVEITTAPGSASICNRTARLGVWPTTAGSETAPAAARSLTTTSPVAMPTRAAKEGPAPVGSFGAASTRASPAWTARSASYSWAWA